MTCVIRVRLPGDRSFIYVRLEGRRVEVRLIRRRYWCRRRVEVMRFRTSDNA